ncbi:integrase core domain-containing protein [Arcanobacterium phocae]|uniref:integrase core domain-containing protein n=1 Tax=Arcanobacterium phocae TaxID=131112 RepID=UPI001C0EDA19|nr:integrase core domain-containing protein [Arcanobacterium phocae]
MCEENNWADSPLQTTARSMCPLFTMSVLPSMGLLASTGTVGDSYDNALAENVNGSYKNELIHRRSWADVVDVEIAAFEWVSWWNESRLHQSLGYRTPAEVEQEFWNGNTGHEIIEIKARA